MAETPRARLITLVKALMLPWRWMVRHAEGLQVLLTLVAMISSVTVAYVGIQVAEQANTIADHQAELMRMESSPFLRVKYESPSNALSSARDLVMYNVGAPIGRIQPHIGSFIHLCHGNEANPGGKWTPLTETATSIPVSGVFREFQPTGNFTGEVGRWADGGTQELSFASSVERIQREFREAGEGLENFPVTPCIFNYVEVFYTDSIDEVHVEGFELDGLGREQLLYGEENAIAAEFEYRVTCHWQADQSSSVPCRSIAEITGGEVYEMFLALAEEEKLIR